MIIQKITPSQAYEKYKQVCESIGHNHKKFDAEIAAEVLTGYEIIPEPEEDRRSILTKAEACDRMRQWWKWSVDYDTAEDAFDALVGTIVMEDE